MKLLKVKCLTCDASFETEKPVIGEILDCPDCGLNLIVKSLNNGIQLEIVSEEEEDWGE